jgi:hypothetical protein
MRPIVSTCSLLVCLCFPCLAGAADKPLFMAAGDGSGLFATESGGEELEMFALHGGAVIIGLSLLFLAYWTAKKGSAKVRAVILALLGIGLIVGSILYGQIRLNQIEEKYKKKREDDRQKQGQRL